MTREEVADAIVKITDEGCAECNSFDDIMLWLSEQCIDDGDVRPDQVQFLANCFELGINVEL